jgi:sugar lactone lactonase YvrE
VEDEGIISDLHYNNKTGALYAAGGKDGVLYRLTEQGEGPIPTLIARSLGWPVGMSVDVERRRIFVGDARGKQIWRIDCPDEDSCEEPRVLIQDDIFRSPSEIDVAADGTVWVADRSAGLVVALSPEGEVLQKITDLPRE